MIWVLTCYELVERAMMRLMDWRLVRCILEWGSDLGKEMGRDGKRWALGMYCVLPYAECLLAGCQYPFMNRAV